MALKKIQLYTNEGDIIQLGKNIKKTNITLSARNSSFYRGISSISLFPVKRKVKTVTSIQQYSYLSSSLDSLRLYNDWRRVGSYIRKSARIITSNCL